MSKSLKANPGYIFSLFSMKCPRCRRGSMFSQSNPYKNLSLKNIFKMPEKCAVCAQKFEVEQGFWYGTGYVSYAVTVAFSVSTFVAWWVLIGISVSDNRIFWWLGVNGFLLLIVQPWLMRFCRVLYLYFFVKYDEDYESHQPAEFDN